MFRIFGLVIVFILVFGANVAFASGGSSLSEIKRLIEQRLQAEDAGDDVRVDNMAVYVGANREVVSYNNFVKKSAHETFELVDLEIDQLAQKFTAYIKSLGVNNIQAKLFGRYKNIVEIPVLSKRMRRGDIVGEEDIKYIKLDVKRLKAGVIIDDRDMIGKELKRMLSSNRQVTSRDLGNPTIIKAKTMVPLVFRTRLIEIKTIAKALESGSEGDIISVKNAKSGVVVQAMVSITGEVIVNYGANILNRQYSETKRDKNKRVGG